ncbi:hypothetical protein CRUP_017166 [Coryphaenoides rupestris]|nr:hypothetical protein CRUP_017166 [Coryphaenoides rupestris]
MPSGSKRLFNYTDDAGRSRLVVQWNYTQATRWDLVPMCSVYIAPRVCCSTMDVTFYIKREAREDWAERLWSGSMGREEYLKAEETVWSGEVSEQLGHQYTLQCHVQEVAPVQNLTVTFYRGGATLGEVQSCRNSSKKSTKSPVSETFTVSINSSREDDGVQYWCEAQLDLGPQGPQPPPVMRSLKLNDMVYLDFLPIVAGLVALVLVCCIIVAGFVYNTHYRHTRMGHYKLKNVFRIGRSGNAEQNGG